MSEIRLPAERKHEAELKALAAADKSAKPPGWALSPRAVETYVMGSDKPVGGVTITPKYVGDRSLVQVAHRDARLGPRADARRRAGHREELAQRASVRGDQRHERAGRPGHGGHQRGAHQVRVELRAAARRGADARRRSSRRRCCARCARARSRGFEEITRTSSEIQDSLISILSEKQIEHPRARRDRDRAARLQHHRAPRTRATAASTR